MFGGWDNFYLLIGSAAGALVGILFLIITLTADLEASTAARGAQIYTSPIVFNFTVVLIVSAFSFVPRLPPAITGIVLLGLAIWGFVYSGTNLLRIFDRKSKYVPDWTDIAFHGVIPTLSYIVFIAGVCSIWFAPATAPYLIGAAALVLLINGIRNAWDLATFLMQMVRDRSAK